MSLKPIGEIASSLGIGEEYLEQYGKWKGKIDLSILDSFSSKKDGKLILVTAITPTKAGEGKTTTSIALAEGFGRIKQKALLCLREPALGPVFGLKGGATGAGLASIEPAEDINLHFNGDFHALTSAINLISAVLDNSLYQGNPLHIDPSKIVWTRAMDMNERTLRNVRIGIGDKNGVERIDHFTITVASELMAIFCLARDEEDFLSRLEKIIVAYSTEDKPITVKDLEVTHAVMRLMKEAFKPNLVQTLENNPVLVHGGPFANIAHGCNSLIATKMALKLAPITITEAGFAADLGAEKFLDIVSVEGSLHPDLAILVASIKALKMHGGVSETELDRENVDALLKGTANLNRHYENLRKFGLPVLIAINRFPSDTEEEIKALERWCLEKGYSYSLVEGYAKGGEGAIDLANKSLSILQKEPSHFKPIYQVSSSLKDKISTIAQEIYRAKEVDYSEEAEKQIAQFEKMGFSSAYICMAKTPNSFSDDPKLINAPTDFSIHVREVKLGAGSNFVIPLTGKVMTMPGLPKVPAAVKMEKEPW